MVLRGPRSRQALRHRCKDVLRRNLSGEPCVRRQKRVQHDSERIAFKADVLHAANGQTSLCNGDDHEQLARPELHTLKVARSSSVPPTALGRDGAAGLHGASDDGASNAARVQRAGQTATRSRQHFPAKPTGHTMAGTSLEHQRPAVRSQREVPLARNAEVTEVPKVESTQGTRT